MTERAPAQPRRWPRGVTLYIGILAIAALAAIAGSWVLVGPPGDPIALATLIVLGLLSVVLREPDAGSRVTFSFLSIIVISSVVLVGPVGSALVGGLSMAFERGNRPAPVRLFNTVMVALHGVVGGLVYLVLGGATLGGARDITTLDGPGALLLRVGLPLIAADVAQMLINAILLAGVVRLSSGVPLRRFFVQIVSNSGLAYIGYGFIGFLFVILWVPADVGPFSAALILAPLMVARWAFVQFGEEQRAHERALSALVTAVETKDPHAAGHSARIAQLAEWVAEPLSMGAQEVQALRYAAMLHDVGKVGVPAQALRGRRAPSRSDLEALTRHCEYGVELVGNIDFLGQSLDGIRHHHERWDGRGYPDGLAAEAIPLSSRVIAVADAFDALTTDRPERPALTSDQAVKELERRRGQQFDPAVVAALVTALERHQWSPAPFDAQDIEAARGYVDHDDPTVWERVWTPPVQLPDQPEQSPQLPPSEQAAQPQRPPVPEPVVSP